MRPFLFVDICYILYSKSIDQFYIGCTSIAIGERLQRHNEGYYDSKWTLKGVPWEVFMLIECDSMFQARSIESHIKKMKSRVYINNLKSYPEIINKLKLRYLSNNA